MHKIIGVFLLLFFINIAVAEKSPFKFGKVTEEEMAIQECDFEPDAKSMIIGEMGDLKFQYDNLKGWQYRMEVEVRKKIFEITDADQGNIKIRVYDPLKGSSKEEISNLKAFVYNIVDGKIEKEKVENKEFFRTRLNDYNVEVSFAIPNIQKGSIIEYKYTKISDYYYNLSTWYFQSDIPCKYSKFEFTVPEYFNYQISQLGNAYQTEIEKNERPEVFTYKYDIKASTNKLGGKTQTKGTGTLNSTSNYQKMAMSNIPSTIDEPYLNNPADVPSRLQFQLVSRQFPNQIVDVVAGSYDKFNDELIKRENFGKRLKNGSFIKDLETSLSEKSELQKAQLIYNHIKSHFSWNDVYSFLSSDAGRLAYNKKEGHVADINLTLIAALREYGISASPVLLSTRGHGTVHPVYPSYADFNYVLALVKVEDKSYLLDATNRLPFGDLSQRCRNGNGWVVTENGGNWIDMKTNSKYNETTLTTIQITDDKIISHVSNRKSDYAAYNAIRKINSGSKEEYAESIAKSFDDGTLEGFEVEDLSYEHPVVVKYDIVRDYDGAETIYLQPIISGTIVENPFSRDKRISIIDYTYTLNYKVIVQIDIPDGYSVEIPESVAIGLPNDGGLFRFQANKTENKVSITSIFTLNKTIFTNLEYQNLKTFYQYATDKNKELIIIKK